MKRLEHICGQFASEPQITAAVCAPWRLEMRNGDSVNAALEFNSSVNPIMQCSNAVSLSRVLLALQSRFHAVTDSLDSDPKIAELMDTSLGKYLNGHPFLTLSLLVFGAMATVPVGLFLVFAMATFITAAVAFMLLEVFLLSLGGAALLCALCAVAPVTVVVSTVLAATYVTASNALELSTAAHGESEYCSPWLSEEKRGRTKNLGSKNQRGQ
ncbi:hypothetical protein AAFF_G00212140 [Aldrovandia affinis]|uniref:Uncharacterized protein n=1 Tax=Aldrovandia affinis TaxID=143900 RepID=A0AAD7W5C4_9TELE|nr:hypothetical protein AAFF_G00212140 [Aldrovandia affinis]